MTSQRPPSSMGRPVSRSGHVHPGAGRPPTALRPPTAMRVATGMVPGTSGHPGMRGGIPMASPGVLSAPIKVTDRPVTQQGLSGMKTGMKGPQRQILDKSYYLGLLRTKINKLLTETAKVNKDIDICNQENSVYLSYEKRAESMAGELKDLQGQFADHNMLMDKLNTNTEMEDMVSDYTIVKAQNKNEAESIDIIFTERREREELNRAVEEEISRERQVADEVIQTMPAAKREIYFNMAATNEELLQEITVLQEELDIQTSRKEELEAELAQSHIKLEIVRLQENLSAMELKRDAMEAEHKNLGSPQEEREKLLKQAKHNNQEIATITRQMMEIRNRTGRITEEIRQLEQDSEEVQGESQQKYKDLKKKEEEMDRLLESFDESKAQEEKRMTEIQENIVSFMEQCSRNMLRLQQVDTVTANELRNMQEVLVSKETEVVHSACTAKGLTTESQRLQQDLEKVQQLEGKITSELRSLKDRVSTMESELETYSDLDALRHKAEETKTRLQEEHESLTQHQDSFKRLLEETNQQYEGLKSKLQDNETHAQLANIERKWQHLEQNNFMMKEFIALKCQDSNYDLVAQRVYRHAAEYNKTLMEALQNIRC